MKNDHPRLLLTAAEMEGRRARFAAAARIPDSDPDTAALFAKVLETASLPRPASWPEDREQVQHKWRVQALTVAYALTGEERWALEAYRDLRDLLAGEAYSDLGQSARSIVAALAYDWCFPAWSEAERREVAQWLGQTVRGFRRISDGNPDNPFNNWWGVTHSAAGICALSVLGDIEGMEEELARCRARVKLYLCNYGDAGYSYEGPGYGSYAAQYWALYAILERKFGTDLFEWNPGARHFAETLCALAVMGSRKPAWYRERKEQGSGEEEPLPEGASFFLGGSRLLCWNDANHAFPNEGEVACFFGLVPPEKTEALRWFYDRGAGRLGTGTFYPTSLGWAMGFALYPEPGFPRSDSFSGPPQVPFATRLFDRRMGLVLFRNRYRDHDDIVFGAYAKAYHGGGHEHDDVGSFRFFGLDAAWSVGGGQAKSARIYQSMLLRNMPDDPFAPGAAAAAIAAGRPQAGPSRLGKVLFYEPGARGGSVSLRLKEAYGTLLTDRHLAFRYAETEERGGADSEGGAGSAAFSRQSGENSGKLHALLGIADHILERSEEASRWTFSLCYENGLELTLEPEANGFTLFAPWSGASLVARFGGEKARFRALESPASRRTFSNGKSITYPGSKIVTATWEPVSGATGPVERLFLAAFALYRGREKPPEIAFSGEGKNQEAVVEGFRLALDQSRWLTGPLRILPAT